MTVTSLKVRTGPYYPNGATTVFPFDFEASDTDEVAVSIDGVQIAPAFYEVTLNDDGTGQVDFFAAPLTGTLYVYADPVFSQTTSFENQGPYFQATVQTVVDRLSRRALWLKDAVTRAIRGPTGEVMGELPAAASRANRYLGFDALGNPIVLAGGGGSNAADLALSTGATMLGTASGRTLATVLSGFAAFFLQPNYTLTAIDAHGDSFSEAGTVHSTVTHKSMVEKFADLRGISGGNLTINAVSGRTSADGQTALFTQARPVDRFVLLNFGQNDAQFLGTATDNSLREADLHRIHLANICFAAKADGTNKVMAATVSGGQLAVAGAWSADGDLAVAKKASVAGAAMEATFTNCRYAVLLYKAKVGSTGRFYIKNEADDTNHPVFSAAPESGWVPTNTGQTWAVMARVYDAGTKLPELKMQAVIDASTGGGDVSFVGFLGFSGDGEAGPRVGVGDVSRRGAAGYATAAGSEVNVPIVNRSIELAMGRAAAMGGFVMDMPIASVIGPSGGLDTDQFHPSESGSTSISLAWDARITAARPLAGTRPDLVFQGAIMNSAGEYTPGMAYVLDRQMRWRPARIGGGGLYFTADDNTVRMSTSGVLFAPVASDGSVQTTKGILMLADGNHVYFQGGVGDTVFGNAGSNHLRVTNTSFDPETDNAYSMGSSSKAYAAMWTAALVHKRLLFASLPTPSATIEGAAYFITDANVATGVVTAGGGTNRVPIRCRSNGASFEWRVQDP